MPQIQQFRLASYSTPASTTTNYTLVPAAAGKPIKVWRVLCSNNSSTTGAAFILSDSSGTGQVLTVALVSPAIFYAPYDGAPILYIQPGDALYFSSNIAATYQITVWYTIGG